MSRETDTTLGELREPLTEALRRLIAKDEDRKPFVIVEERVTERWLCFSVRAHSGRFVQFAGSKTRPLLYDCPPLGVYNSYAILDVAIERGLEGLRLQRLEPDSPLRIIESESGPPRRRFRDLFRRLTDAEA